MITNFKGLKNLLLVYCSNYSVIDIFNPFVITFFNWGRGEATFKLLFGYLKERLHMFQRQINNHFFLFLI